MVRYPHTATVSVVQATITEGEYTSEDTTPQEIRGRLERSSGYSQRVKSPAGDWTDLQAKFFTKAEKITGAEKLTVEGQTFVIILWEQYQTYSEIWLG